MTKHEFVSRWTEMDRQCRGAHWGLIYSVFAAMLGFIFYLIGCVLYFVPHVPPMIVGELFFCFFVLGGIYGGVAYWKRRIDRSALCCQSCHRWLDLSVTQTERCNHCGEAVVFDQG